MFQVPKGNHLDTGSLKSCLAGNTSKRQIILEVVTDKTHGRPARQIVVIDQAQGMSAAALKTALEDIGGDRKDLAAGQVGRNLFGRGLSDVMRAHQAARVETFNGVQLTIATGEWVQNDRWTITRDYQDDPTPKDFKETFLHPTETGTAVQFVADKRCQIPQTSNIVSKLANFYMLRLVAADPNVEVVLKQYRKAGVQRDRVTFDFPVGQVIDSFTRTFDPNLGFEPLKVDFLLARSDRKLEGAAPDRDARENGLLIVDDLDAVYDLTFGDPDYEKAEFLKHIFGIVRVTGLRAILEAYLNSPDFPTSPLRVDRDGFNREHEFSKALMEFLANELRPSYERERKRIEEKEQGKYSEQTRKRIDEALKHLNKYFQEITEKAGIGQGGDSEDPEPPKDPVSFSPRYTSLIVGHPRRVLLLVRDDIVTDGCQILTTSIEGIAVQPEIQTIYRKQSPRWTPHPNFFCFPLTLMSSTPGLNGAVTSLVECVGGQSVEASIQIEEVLEEPAIIVPATMEFRPQISMGRPGRRNNLTLLVNSHAITEGHYVRFIITKRTGGVELIDEKGSGVQQLDVKLDVGRHGVPGQQVFRILTPWRGTAWNQHGTVEARTKVGGESIIVAGQIHLDETPENDGGFFQRVEYDELDDHAPSKFAAGVITVNTLDPLNRLIFGSGETKDDVRKEFDRRLSEDQRAQQRLASVLLEEASFRALEQLHIDNKLPLPQNREIDEIHSQIDRYKFSSAVNVYKALVK